MLINPNSPTGCRIILGIRLAMVAPNVDTTSAPEVPMFQTTAVLQRILGSFQSTSGHAVTIVEEDFAPVSTIMIVINFNPMLYFNFRGSEEEG